MWASNSAPKEAGTSSKRGVPAQGGSQNQDFRVVERVAYAHPVRDHQMYYAPKGNNQYEQRQPPPIPPHPNNHGVGYPYYSAPQPQYEGRARVRRGEHNSECVLFDPSESVVIDYVDGASSGPPRLRSRGHHPPPLPPSKSTKPCIHKQHRTHPAPVAYNSDLGSSSEVTLATSHKHYSHRVTHHHHHHSSSHNHNHPMPTVYMPGGHVDMQYHVHAQPQQPVKPPSSRGSHSSDTSSAYSGSDTMQSLHSNDPIDLEGLHESVVDSDEDLADSMDSLHVRDIVRDSLEKDPGERTSEDLEILLEFTQKLEAFNHMTMAVRRALCSVMVFAVVEKAGTTVMMDQEELDSWSVIINGKVQIESPGHNAPKYLECGDSFGITPTMDKLYHNGTMKTIEDDCQFVCITQSDYYKILNDGETNQKRVEENGQVVLVSEYDASIKNGFKVIRGTPEKLLSQLVDENFAVDPNYADDFFLTYRTFMSKLKVMEFLLESMNEGKSTDKVTRDVMIWVDKHFLDFETDPKMMEYLEDFESLLEQNPAKSGQLRMLHFACASRARKRTVTLTRPSRDEPLQFTLMGGSERGFGIFLEKVERGSKASEIGLKRGDQILEVNRRSFEQNMSLEKATLILKENTHLEMNVKSNLLVFKEMLHAPEHLTRSKTRKTSDGQGLRNSGVHSTKGVRGVKDEPSKPKMPLVPLSGRERFKVKIGKMFNSAKRNPNVDSELNPNNLLSITDSDGFEIGVECPEHALRIYKSDQQSKYLLVHQETRAKEVVMLALQEFGITEVSSNYCLYEVTVENGSVRQKLQPDDQTNLAERIGISSRYYIKNRMSSDQLITDDVESELSKESIIHLLDLSPMEAAMQLMVEDFTTFQSIEMTEYIDDVFKLESAFGTPNLTKFGNLVNEEMFWVITEIVSENNQAKRVKIIKQFIKIAHHCYKDTQNFNSMFAIVQGLKHRAVERLKKTQNRLPDSYKKLLDDMSMVMDPSRNFSKYRNLINNAKPPLIPIYPMVSKDLTFVDLGNKSKIEGLINFEKLRMITKEIRGLMNMCSANLDIFTIIEARSKEELASTFATLNPKQAQTMKRPSADRRGKSRETLNPRRMHEEAQMVRRVKAYLVQRSVIQDEEELLQMSYKCEPDPHSHSGSKSMTNHPSTTSITSTQSGPPPKRMPSPSPSAGSTNSAASLVSEGRKSTTSGGAAGAKKFGTDSPKAVRKLMSLSEPGKTRQRRAKHSVSSLHSMNSPPASPPPVNAKKVKGHERSQSDCSVTPPVSLSAESSSVTSLQSRIKNANHILIKGGVKSKLPSNLEKSHPGLRLARTISREPQVKESSVDDDDDDDFDDGQVSAV